MKITIDEGFFGFFFDLEAKKKRQAGEAIDNISLFFKKINAPLGLLFGIAPKTNEKTLARCKPNKLSFQNEGLPISPPTPGELPWDPISVRSNVLLRI